MCEGEVVGEMGRVGVGEADKGGRDWVCFYEGDRVKLVIKSYSV